MSSSKDTKEQQPQGETASGDNNRAMADAKAFGVVGPATMMAPFQFKMPGTNCHTSHFKPDRDIPDLAGKVILVTGGNAGIGKQAVLEFAKHNPAKIYLAARSASKAEEAINEIKAAVPGAPITHLPLDLSSLESVKKAGETVNSTTSRLDILMLNAGIMAPPFATTADGYESQMGTNHIGHAGLTKLVLPLLLKTAESVPNADVRIISLSSLGHRMAPTEGLVPDLEGMKKLDPWQRYGHSKLANALFAKELARRHPQLKAIAIHPGIGVTNLYQASASQNPLMALSFKMSSMMLPDARQLALNQLWASVSDKVQNGQYYEPVGRLTGASGQAKDEKLAMRLWDWTEEELAKHGF